MSFRKPALFAGVAVTALVGGAGAAYAATHSASPAQAQTASAATTPSPAASAPSATRPGGHFKPGAGFGRFGFGLGAAGAIHGQFTVPKSGGGYQTIDVQSGTVSSVSSSSITVKSADGFTATYAVTSSTEVNAESAGIGAVKSGDTVYVTATTSGGSDTAANITDLTSIRQSRGSFGFPDKPPAGQLPAGQLPADPGSTGTS